MTRDLLFLLNTFAHLNGGIFILFFAGLKEESWVAFDNPGKAVLLVFKQNSCRFGYSVNRLFKIENR